MSLLTGCSASMLPAGPNLIGAKQFIDESAGEEELIFQKKQTLKKLNLPAPSVTGANQETKSQAKIIAEQDYDEITRLILADLRKHTQQ